MSNTPTRILWLRHAGLKAHDAKHELTPSALFLGENGQGKSTVIESIHLLATGEAPGVDRNSDGVLSLARGDRLEIEAEIQLGDRGRVRVTRSWSRGKDGRITQKITNSALNGSISEHKAWLSHTLGGFGDAFKPEIFWSLSPAKMRERLLRVLPRAEKDLAAIVPADCPPWALPQSEPEPEVWVRTAIDAAKYELAHRQATLRALEVELEAVGEAWTGAVPLEPIQARLKRCRGWLLDIRTKELAQGRAEKVEKEREALIQKVDRQRVAVPTQELLRLREEVADLQRLASLDAPSFPVAALVHAVVLAAVEETRAQKKVLQSQIAGGLEMRVRLKSEIGVECKGVAVDTPEHVDALALEVAALEQDIRDAERALRGVKTGNDTRIPPGLKCPHCQGDIAKLFEHEVAQQKQALRDLEDHHVMLSAALRCAEVELAQARRGVELAGHQRALQALSAEMAKWQAERDRLPAEEGPIDEAAARVQADYDRIMETHRARKNLARRIQDLATLEREVETDREMRAREDETRIAALGEEREALRSEVSKLAADKPEGSIEQIEGKIRELEGDLQAAVKVNERAARLTQAEEDKVRIGGQIEAVKLWLATFQGIEADLVKKAKLWIETQLSALGGGTANVEVQMYDARGHEDCKFVVNGVAVETLSPGARLPFMAALVVALAGASNAGWKPLLIDELEHVSLRYREGFLRAIVSAVENGAVSQAILAGCCDTPPNVEGLSVLCLDEPKLKAVR